MGPTRDVGAVTPEWGSHDREGRKYSLTMKLKQVRIPSYFENSNIWTRLGKNETSYIIIQRSAESGSGIAYYFRAECSSHVTYFPIVSVGSFLDLVDTTDGVWWRVSSRFYGHIGGKWVYRHMDI